MRGHLHYNTETLQWEVRDENHHTMAVGTLELDLIPGAQRHGSLQFVSEDRTADTSPLGILAGGDSQ